MNNTIYNTSRCSDGKYHTKERVIAPRNQAEADAIYQDLDGYMTDEAIFQDGEASLATARQTFTFYLQKAKQVKKLGFLPRGWPETDFAHDVFYPQGYVPTSWAEYQTGSRFIKEDESLKNDDWREGFYEVRVFANIPVEFTVTVKADDEDDAIKAAQIEVDKMPTKTLLAHDQYEEPAVYESTDWHVLGIEESHGYENTPEDLKAANQDAWNVEDES